MSINKTPLKFWNSSFMISPHWKKSWKTSFLNILRLSLCQKILNKLKPNSKKHLIINFLKNGNKRLKLFSNKKIFTSFQQNTTETWQSSLFAFLPNISNWIQIMIIFLPKFIKKFKRFLKKIASASRTYNACSEDRHRRRADNFWQEFWEIVWNKK